MLGKISTMTPSPIYGEYHFQKHEMVAAFRFSKDGKFQFYYIYGAVDRNATGTFTVEGDVVKLKSDKEAGRDFTVDRQERKSGGYHLLFRHPNKYLVDHIRVICFIGEEHYEDVTGSSGEVHIDLPRCDRIYLQHGLFPDVVTQIKDEANENNYFELSLNPSLEQVSFKGVDLKIEGDRLTCLPNYLMPLEGIAFVKHGE